VFVSITYNCQLYAYAKKVLEKKLDSGNMAMGTAGEGSALLTP
jgi:hypothetical protein